MLPPLNAVRPLWIADPDPPGALTLTGAAPDLIGTLDELKTHVAVEHAEDDAYLRTLHLSALQAVGDYTRWPMRTGSVWQIARYRWPMRGTRQRRLLLPGPVDPNGWVQICLQHGGGQIEPGSRLTDVRPLPRLPNDAVVTLLEDFTYDDMRTGELLIRYRTSWSALYPDPGWPVQVAHTVYRCAATLYLYREATMAGDTPVRKIVMSTLGPYLPVEV